jgi:nucleotide-binding universal stress UspA family protein
MYRHILIPLENSATDDAILGHIKPLARLTQARITLIHVADGFMARSQERFEESPEMQEDRAYLQKRQEELAADQFPVSAILACGDPASQIVSAAEKEGCDLIAMATHGHTFLADLVLGSVASTVRHRTTLPVLLIRAGKSTT